MYNIFFSKLTLGTSTVCGQQQSCLNHERIFSKKFSSQKMARPREDLNPQPSGSYGILSHLSYRSQIFAIPYFGIDIFVCKVNIWNVRCSRATAFIWTHEQVFLETCPSFCDRKCIGLVGPNTHPPTFIWFRGFLYANENIMLCCGSSVGQYVRQRIARYHRNPVVQFHWYHYSILLNSWYQ